MGTVNIWEHLTTEEAGKYAAESEQRSDEDATTWAARVKALHDAYEETAFSRSEGGTATADVVDS